MLVAVICQDKPESLQIRLDTRPAHLEHIKSSGIVVQAGPFIDGAGEMCGSLVILSVDTMEEAEAWAANDPYALAGLFETVAVIEWKRVIG